MEVQNYVDGLLNIPGMKFRPEEHHLLQFYLSRKINGEPLPWNGIRDFDVYGEQGPWELIHGQTSSEPAYAFAISKNLSPHMKKRTCKFGTWKLQNNNTPVPHQGQTIGWKAYLSFYPDEKLKIDPNFLGGSWNMNEYSLPGYQEKEGLVICRVTFRAWTEKERVKRGLEETPAASSSGIDVTARPRKRTRVARGSGNNWREAPCASVSSYLNRDHSSSSNISIVEDQSHPFACAPSCSDQEINKIAELEAPSDVSCYNLETNTVPEQPPYASESSYFNCGNLDHCSTSSNIYEEQSHPYACVPSCSDQEINSIAELEGSCDFSCYNLETKIVEEQSHPYACVPSCSDQEINTTADLKAPCDVSCYNLETKIVEEQSHPYACVPSCSDQEINTTADLKAPCDVSCYNLETNTVAEQPSYVCAPCSDQGINNTAELEGPCDFACYNLETNTVAEQPPYACALPCSDQEINTTTELEGPCNFSCLNLETNTVAEQPPYDFPWFSNLESFTVVEQPPSPYALSYYDVEESHTNTTLVEELQQPEACGGFSSTSNPESNTNTTVVEELLQSWPPASGAFPRSSNLLGQQQLSSILSLVPERRSWEDYVVPEYLAVVGELWS